MKEFLLNLLSTTLENVGESKLIEVLQQLHEKNPEQYKAAILGGKALVLALLPVVGKTGTKIDDAIINSLSDAIELSAAANGVALPTKVVV